MFIVDEDKAAISMSVGDTGSFTVTATGGYTFAAEDRALFTVKDGAGEIVLERVYALADAEQGNGVFTVNLANADTDQLTPGAYSWDVRYVINPYYDETGRIVSGDQVITPKLALTLTLLPVVGEV